MRRSRGGPASATCEASVPGLLLLLCLLRLLVLIVLLTRVISQGACRCSTSGAPTSSPRPGVRPGRQAGVWQGSGGSF